jgi:hypothetical protein
VEIEKAIMRVLTCRGMSSTFAPKFGRVGPSPAGAGLYQRRSKELVMDPLAARIAWREYQQCGFRLVLALSAMNFCPIASALAQGTPSSIVESTGDLNPEYSKAKEPSAEQLIETWRSSNKFMTGKRVDRERFEITDRRVVSGKYPRAFLQFRILPPQGDALAFAQARCVGRTNPIEIQVFYQWSGDLGAWVALGQRGEGSEDLCSDDKLWTADQIEKLVNPPPLPTPPTISMADVTAPRAGSPERTGIMNALRPRYEDMFGPPIVFKVDILRVAAGFAFVVVHPQRPNGTAIEQSVWQKAFGAQCFQNPRGVSHEYWMKLEGGIWRIGVKNNMCADDSISEEGDRIGAPPQLVGKNAWPEREFPPDLN